MSEMEPQEGSKQGKGHETVQVFTASLWLHAGNKLGARGPGRGLVQWEVVADRPRVEPWRTRSGGSWVPFEGGGHRICCGAGHGCRAEAGSGVTLRLLRGAADRMEVPLLRQGEADPGGKARSTALCVLSLHYGGTLHA